MEIRIKNRMEEMPAVVSMVKGFGAHHGISDAVINEINLVLDEVFGNIISGLLQAKRGVAGSP